MSGLRLSDLVSFGALICAGVYWGWQHHEKRPVLKFSPAATAEVEAAAPGRLASIRFSYEVLRDGCRLKPASARPFVIIGGSGPVPIYDRTPITSEFNVGTVRPTIKFLVPQNVPVGVGTFWIEGDFDCGGWTVHEKSPRYPFEVLERGDGRE